MPKTKVLAILVAVIVAAGLGFFYRDRLLVFIFGKPSPQELQLKIDEIQNFAVKQRNYETALQKAEKLTRLSPDFAEGWHWKGISEFELGKYEEAKKSFEKVLSLEPEHKAAKKYLDIMANNAIIDSAKNSFDREAFESKIGFTIDPASFAFSDAFSLLPNPLQSEMVAANYTSAKNISQSKAYFETVLEDGGFEVSAQDVKDQVTVLGVKSSITISVSIWKRVPLQISLLYAVSK